MNTEKQIELFKGTINKLEINKDLFDDMLNICVPEWNDSNGVYGFPNILNIEIKYNKLKKCQADICLHRSGDKAEWASLEIVSLDVEEKQQQKGIGRNLIKNIKQIAAILHIGKIYGDVFINEYHDSTGFYKKCGFEIYEGMPPRFEMKLNTIDMSLVVDQTGEFLVNQGMGKHVISEEERKEYCNNLEMFLSGKVGNEVVLIKGDTVLLINDVDIAGNILFYYN